MMKSANPQFGDKNIFKLIQNTNAFSKNYSLSNGSSFTLTVEFDDRKHTYSIEVTNINGNFKDFRFFDIPDNVIICKENTYKYECMVLSNFGTSFPSNILLNFVVLFDLKPKPSSTNSTYNDVFKHGLFRSLSFDKFIEFYIRQSCGKEKLYCIIRKVFVINDSKTSYFIYFNWTNPNDDGRQEQSIIKETATEKFMVMTKTPMNETETSCFKMLEDAIINVSNRKTSTG